MKTALIILAQELVAYWQSVVTGWVHPKTNFMS